MEFGIVPSATIAGMIFSMVISITIPVVLLIIAKVKYKAKISTFFIGAGIFILFALILEQILHFVVITAVGGTDKLQSNLLLYALYGGLAAAVFEETGRFIAFKFLMKKRNDRNNAFMYGIGHGGIEAIIIIGLGSISNIATAIMINNGLMQTTLELLDEATKAATYEQLSQLWTLPSYQFFLSGTERISAIALHIGLTFIMYRGVKYGENKNMFIAYLIHFIVDALTVIMSGFIPVALTEVIIFAMAAGTVGYAYLINVDEEEELIILDGPGMACRLDEIENTEE